MEYIELSKKNVEEKSKELYQKISQEYPYDLVIFIAKGSFYIGKVLAEKQQVPLLEISASRKKGSTLKKLGKPILKILPRKLEKYLREKEMNSSVHETKEERNVSFDKELYQKYTSAKKILLVDDSIDTGNSVVKAYQAIKAFFPDSMIKIAVFNFFDKAKEKVKPDYFLYENTMIKGPWANGSKEHNQMIKEYELWHEK